MCIAILTGLQEVNWCLKLKSLVLTGKPMHKERRSGPRLCRVSSRHRRTMPIPFLTNCCVPFAMIWWRTPLSYPAVETATVMNVSLWTHLVILLFGVAITCPGPVVVVRSVPITNAASCAEPEKICSQLNECQQEVKTCLWSLLRQVNQM